MSLLPYTLSTYLSTNAYRIAKKREKLVEEVRIRNSKKEESGIDRESKYSTILRGIKERGGIIFVRGCRLATHPSPIINVRSFRQKYPTTVQSG